MLDNLKLIVDKVGQLEAKLKRQMGKGTCRFCDEPLTEQEQKIWGDQCQECTEKVAN